MKKNRDSKSVKALLNLRVPMRDGVELATHVYMPDSKGPFPVMLTRTPYEAIGKGAEVLKWPEREYAYVVQDVRGRFLSDGDFYPWFNEIDDAEDTLNWLCEQPWCNGAVTMYGGSYPGATQNGAAMTGHPALKCFTPALIGAEFYHTAYWGGAFRLSWQIWALNSHEDTNTDELKNKLPLIDLDVIGGEKAPYWRDGLAHPTQDEFWHKCSMAKHFSKIEAPAFIRTGWHDLFVCDAFDLYNGLRKKGGTQQARDHTRILIGPWPHDINQSKVGEVDFGLEAVVSDLEKQELLFMDYFTAGREGYDLHAAPIRLFIMGANKWRDEYEWPLARTVYTDMFLSSGGNANTANGDGVLDKISDGIEDHFEYNPANPVPTLGGAWDFTNIGSFDQVENESRSDVLVYTSKKLTSDTEVTGSVEIKLFASSSTRDTDFTAKLIDLTDDNKAMSVTDGIIRARYRRLDGSEELLTPGEVYEFSIQCNPTSYLFQKGHRIRLEISSSNFPAFSRNLNTGGEIATETKIVIAEQKIYHTADYPSKILLPIILAR